MQRTNLGVYSSPLRFAEFFKIPLMADHNRGQVSAEAFCRTGDLLTI
jgi:hypothetical protein